ncbi:DUF3306 domain-containing protein [Thalassotalea maritima]|uniref:DUF3306 domain-containing protein n=1 Tax=Thalassotalea maritima TaxID=3242416 RepID=UPI0035280BA0
MLIKNKSKRDAVGVMSVAKVAFWRRWLQRKSSLAHGQQDHPSEQTRQANHEIKNAESGIERNDNRHPSADDKLTEQSGSEASSAKNRAHDVSHDIDTKSSDDDSFVELAGENCFARFVGQDVDEELQQQALRRLWQQPQYQLLDGLEQCDQDFSNQPKLSSEEVDKLLSQVYQCLLADDGEEEGKGEGAEAEQRADETKLDNKPETEIGQHIIANNPITEQAIEQTIEQTTEQTDEQTTWSVEQQPLDYRAHQSEPLSDNGVHQQLTLQQRLQKRLQANDSDTD